MTDNNNGRVQPKRVLLTGHRGYIGSVMLSHLIRAGYQVVGLDTGYFRSCTFVEDPIECLEVFKDIRDLDPSDIQGFDALIHLAALSNDPIGNLNAEWTTDINEHASVRLATLAREAGIPRFLFSSSCIMYGVSEALDVNEESPLAPETEYARSKVRAEAGIRSLASNGFSPTFLRNGTIYGLSPRMRFDTVLNNLVAAAATTGKITVYSDGKPWRPVIHVQDVCRAFLAVLEAPIETVHNEAFNVGANELNQQIIDLAEITLKTVPGSCLEILARPGADQRTYRTDFGKFSRAFPGFQFKWDVAAGARELFGAFQKQGLTYDMFTDRKFTRLTWLRYLLDTGRLDGELRWRAHQEAAAGD